MGATNVAGTLIATSLIEGAGRKQLLLSSYLGMAATMALMAAGFGLSSLASYRWGMKTNVCAVLCCGAGLVVSDSFSSKEEK